MPHEYTLLLKLGCFEFPGQRSRGVTGVVWWNLRDAMSLSRSKGTGGVTNAEVVQ